MRLLPIVLLAVVTGCSLAPPGERPQVAQPLTWSAPLPAGETIWPAAGWWRAFGSPELDALVAAAESGNADIAAAAARLLQADALARMAGSALLPSLDAGAGAARRGFGTDSGRVTSASSLGADLSVSYEVDLFGRNRAGLLAAEASLLQSRFDQETVALSVVSSLATTWFQMLQFQDRLEVARRNLEIAEGVLAIVQARVENGAASPLELMQQRTAVATQRAAIPNLDSQARQARNTLSILLARPVGTVPAAAGGLMDLEVPAAAPGLPSDLLARRPDLQAAEARLAAANADIGAARAALFPSLRLTGGTGFAAPALRGFLDPVNFSYTIAASLVQSIFDGGLREAQVDLSVARYEELVHGYRQAVVSAFADVENALVVSETAAAQENLQAEALTQARLAYELAETRYREGAVDLLTVLDAQRALFQAEDQMVQIRFVRLQAAVALFRALGGGFQVAGR